MPLVSVYLTNYNYAAYLDQAIQSVLNQNFDDYELILIDDGSTDDSPLIMQRYQDHPRVTVIYQENKGLNVSNNIAIKVSQGKYIMRLDADDYLDHHALSVMVSTLERHGFDMVFPDYYVVDEDSHVVSIIRRHNFQKDVSLYDQPAHGACTMIRKDCLLDVSCYSGEFRCHDGYDLWLKLLKKHRIGNVNLPLFYYRQHGENSTKDEHKILATRHAINQKHTGQTSLEHGHHLCIIPIRGMEKDCPMALRTLHDRTVCDIAIDTVLGSRYMSHVILSSPDDRIIDAMAPYADTVILDHRPSAFALPNTHIELTVSYLLDKYQKVLGPLDTITIFYADYPLRKSLYLDELLHTMAIFDVDSVQSVRLDDSQLFKHNGHGLVPLTCKNMLVLERDFLYRFTGGMQSVRYDFYKQHTSIVGNKIGHILIDEESSFSMESALGWEIIQALHDKRRKSHNMRISDRLRISLEETSDQETLAHIANVIDRSL